MPLSFISLIVHLFATVISAGFFGPGVFHNMPKVNQKTGKVMLTPSGEPRLVEAWGGYVKVTSQQPNFGHVLTPLIFRMKRELRLMS